MSAIPRRAVASWVVYDLANTIFSMGVVSFFFPLYVRDLFGKERADGVYSVITAISMGSIFILSPLLGAMTDRARRRMPFLVWSTVICCGCTVFFARGPYAITALLFVIANAAYQAGLQFYDALLPEVSTAENRGRVGGIGVGIGYLGSYIGIGIGFLIAPDERALIFTIIAALFLLFALPCFLFVKERGNPNPKPILSWSMIQESTAQTWKTLRSGHEYPGLIRFLIGRVFYTDAINTVITYLSIYTVNVAVATGLSQEDGEHTARFVLMSAITFAVIGGFAWGRLVDRLGPKRTLDIVLYLWMFVFALAASVGAFKLPVSWLYVVTALAGIAMGGVWSADRPYMLDLTPPDRIGEFYGLYGMVGRFSAVSGPLLWGLVVYLAVDLGHIEHLTGESLAIISLMGMVILSWAILRPVQDKRGRLRFKV